MTSGPWVLRVRGQIIAPFCQTCFGNVPVRCGLNTCSAFWFDDSTAIGLVLWNYFTIMMCSQNALFKKIKWHIPFILNQKFGKQLSVLRLICPILSNVTVWYREFSSHSLERWFVCTPDLDIRSYIPSTQPLSNLIWQNEVAKWHDCFFPKPQTDINFVEI